MEIQQTVFEVNSMLNQIKPIKPRNYTGKGSRTTTK